MSVCPPKPGLTVMTSTRSTSARISLSADAGVAGLMATPARAPRPRICCARRCKCGVASWWTVMMSAPAAAKSATSRSGSTIIRCTSNGRSVCGRMAATTAGPMVRFGTNRPSMTSTWMESAPAAVVSRTTSPKRAKSAERIDGASFAALTVPPAPPVRVRRAGAPPRRARRPPGPAPCRPRRRALRRWPAP